jgi:hypothetical protein
MLLLTQGNGAYNQVGVDNFQNNAVAIARDLVSREEAKNTLSSQRRVRRVKFTPDTSEIVLTFI